MLREQMLKGKFSFEQPVHSGAYEVVIKMLGFNPAIQSVRVKDKPVSITARLTESVTTLNTVNITAKKNAISAWQTGSRYRIDAPV